MKELMTALVNDEDSYGECGAYYFCWRYYCCSTRAMCFRARAIHQGTRPKAFPTKFYSVAHFHCTGYYLATLEAATQHIFDLAEQYEKSAAEAQQLDANGEDVLDGFDEKLLLH